MYPLQINIKYNLILICFIYVSLKLVKWGKYVKVCKSWNYFVISSYHIFLSELWEYKWGKIIRIAHGQSERSDHLGLLAFEEYVESKLGDKYDVQFSRELLEPSNRL